MCYLKNICIVIVFVLAMLFFFSCIFIACSLELIRKASPKWKLFLLHFGRALNWFYCKQFETVGVCSE